MFKLSEHSAFVTRFILTYVALSLIYQFYLSFFGSTVDGITFWTSNIVLKILDFCFYTIEAIPHPKRNSIVFLNNHKSFFQIVEGCNGVSVCITYVSFIIAYSGIQIKAILFAVSGSLITLILNILRICALGALYINEYSQVSIIHDTLFPATLYGIIVLLWLFWIRQESISKKYV